MGQGGRAPWGAGPPFHPLCAGGIGFRAPSPAPRAGGKAGPRHSRPSLGGGGKGFLRPLASGGALPRRPAGAAVRRGDRGPGGAQLPGRRLDGRVPGAGAPVRSQAPAGNSEKLSPGGGLAGGPPKPSADAGAPGPLPLGADWGGQAGALRF